MRFDDLGYVKAWRERGFYPAIHGPLYRLVKQEAEGRRFIDLCSGTGLLGRRLTDAGLHGVAVEANRKSILNGAYGSDFLALEMRIIPSTLTDLSSWMRSAGVSIVVARRCLPELQDSGVTPAMLSDALLDGGADELFIEGRIFSKRARHKLPNVGAEIDALQSAGWALGSVEGSCAYLRGSNIPEAILRSTDGSPVTSGNVQSSAGATSS